MATGTACEAHGLRVKSIMSPAVNNADRTSSAGCSDASNAFHSACWSPGNSHVPYLDSIILINLIRLSWGKYKVTTFNLLHRSLKIMRSIGAALLWLCEKVPTGNSESYVTGFRLKC